MNSFWASGLSRCVSNMLRHWLHRDQAIEADEGAGNLAALMYGAVAMAQAAA